MHAAVTYLDARARAWREGVATIIDGAVRLTTDRPDAALPRLDGVVSGGFTDSHVHLQLVDAAALDDSALGRVVDLGADPRFVSSLRSSQGDREHNDRERTDRKPTEITFAGAFLTPPGGYPSDRDWAPKGAVRQIATHQDAASAVAEMHQSGASLIKVASNAAAGPVFTDEMFAAIVDLASTHDMSVVAHAEGPGEAQRTTQLGARLLAHAPFTEQLTDDDLGRMIGNVTWISTLSIHDGDASEVAVDNLRRFHELGGSILYGTDMGNGSWQGGVSPREITALRDAGIDGAELMRALAPVDPLNPASRLNFFPGCSPETADPLLARPLIPTHLEDRLV